MTAVQAKADPGSATSHMSVQEMADLIRLSPPGQWPSGWVSWENVHQAHITLLNEFVASIPAYPEGRFEGRGIVMNVSAKPGRSSGKHLSHGYLPSAWVSVKELRRHGCTLPVLFCHIGPLEWDSALTRLVEPLGVTVMDLEKENIADPMRILNGWESKVYAVCRAPFEEVLYIDADNIPLSNPEYLFDIPAYRHAGAIFWPDVPPYDRPEWLPPRVWDSVGLENAPGVTAFESGQLLVNKRLCWQELCTARWINEHSDRYYEVVFGDKDTFCLGWNKIFHHRAVTENEIMLRYLMPERMPGFARASLIQYDLVGKPLFQHLTRNKASLYDFPEPSGLLMRKEAAEHLEALRLQWSGVLWQNDSPAEEEQSLMARMRSKTWQYTRHLDTPESRKMRFLEDHRIGVGLARCEVSWNVFIDNDGPLLILSDIDNCPTAMLRLEEDDVWRGAWLRFEKCPVEISQP